MTEVENHEPRLGEKVWREERLDFGKQPNGYIFAVIYEGQEVLVRYHDHSGDIDTFSFEELEVVYFAESFGGSYLFYKGLS